MAGIGIDIVRIDRIQSALDAEGELYLENVFTPAERMTAAGHPNQAAYYATRFAAKEAVFKALGLSWQAHMEWTQIAVAQSCEGGLSADLTGAMAEAWGLSGRASISVSVSWDKDYAVAAAYVSPSGHFAL